MLLKRDNVERLAEGIQADRLKAQGFKSIESVACDSPSDVAMDIINMNVTQLKALAKEKGIQGAKSLNKEELRTVLKDVV
jgi:hypothetical protein